MLAWGQHFQVQWECVMFDSFETPIYFTESKSCFQIIASYPMKCKGGIFGNTFNKSAILWSGNCSTSITLYYHSLALPHVDNLPRLRWQYLDQVVPSLCMMDADLRNYLRQILASWCWGLNFFETQHIVMASRIVSFQKCVFTVNVINRWLKS